MKKLILNICLLMILTMLLSCLVITIILALGRLDKYESDDPYKFLSQTESTYRVFPPISEFKTEAYDFYHYEVEASEDTEIFLRLTYENEEAYSERLQKFLSVCEFQSSVCNFNENYVEYFPLPSWITIQGKSALSQYQIHTDTDGEFYINLTYYVISASKQDLTIVFYSGRISDNVTFKHYPKYMEYFKYCPTKEMNCIVWLSG